jgi:ubiquinol-cytochrome c reductase iron-sulfur subunit
MRKNSKMKNKILIYVILCVLVCPVLALGTEFPESQIEDTESAFIKGIEVDVSKLPAGSLMRVIMGNIPIWVYKRTKQDLSQLKSVPLGKLSDPDDNYLNELIEKQYYSITNKPFAQLMKYSAQNMRFNSYRSVSDDYFIVVGFSPHSGCYLTFKTTKFKQSENITFYDPCTDTKYDGAGRIYKGTVRKLLGDEPAKYNLIIPPYRITSTNKIVLGLLPGAPELPALKSKHREKYKTLNPTETLMLAASMNDHAVIHSSIKNGANPYYQKIGKGSVIDSAIMGSSTNIVKMLLQMGVKPTHSSLEIAKMLHRDDVIKLLEQHSE